MERKPETAFISQAQISTGSPRNSSRVYYLQKELRGDLEQWIEDYFLQNPTGDAVTLDVFKKLGRAKIQGLIEKTGFSLGRIKQDIGMAIPIIGAQLFSPETFFTYRNVKTGQSSQRQTSRADREATYLVSYTPHRVIGVPTIKHIFGMVPTTTDGVQYQNELRREEQYPHQKHP